jgi:multimeric flavodoxin WrbA
MNRAASALRAGVTDLDERSFLFILGSSRIGGNAETLARQAALALPPGASQRWLRLRDLPLAPFEDHRHPRGYAYPEPSGHERLLLEATMEATDLVIVSPLYWYSVSASTKLYLDYWSAWLHLPDVAFRNRMAESTLWAITVTSHEEADKADPLVGTLRNAADYLGMRWGGALIGHGNRPDDIRADADALAQADAFLSDRAGMSAACPVGLACLNG